MFNFNCFFKNKKGVMVPTVKTFLILFITSIILVSFILVLNQYTKYTIDEKKINQQLVVNKLFNGKCFSDEFGVIESQRFISENLNDCFQGLPEDKILIKIGIMSSTGKEISGKDSFMYVGSEEEFENKYKFYGLDSNILISSLEYPVIFYDDSGAQRDAILIVRMVS